jgi:hypothetical protein
MIRKALIVLATGTAMLAVPYAAQSQSYGQQPAPTTTAPASTDNTTPSDSAKAKTNDDSSDTETVIRAGPNAGQVIHRHHRPRDMSKDANKAPPKDSQCEQPCV